MSSHYHVWVAITLSSNHSMISVQDCTSHNNNDIQWLTWIATSATALFVGFVVILVEPRHCQGVTLHGLRRFQLWHVHGCNGICDETDACIGPRKAFKDLHLRVDILLHWHLYFVKKNIHPLTHWLKIEELGRHRFVKTVGRETGCYEFPSSTWSRLIPYQGTSQCVCMCVYVCVCVMVFFFC